LIHRLETLSVIPFQFRPIQSNQRLRIVDRVLGHRPAAMSEFKYRAFLSYSHRDTAWAKWLHRALEGYRIDKDLVGRSTPVGLVPKTLRPVFRDREDFSAGHSLNEQTTAALLASDFLIAICSPNAARSAYVNEEIRQFKALRGGARVIPIIIDGEPGDTERECFPASIRFKLGPDAALTEEREEPIAADARPEGDGKEIAKQKIVAGLLGLPLDQIMRRAERARKRRNRVRAFAAVAAILILAAGYLGWSKAVGFAGRLDSSQLLGMETDSAEDCARASKQAVIDKVAEARRITFAVKCVRVLSFDVDDLATDARVPRSFIWSFGEDVAILQKFADAGRLTAEQSAVLAKGKTTLARLKRLCSQSDGTNNGDLGFSC